MSQLTRADVVLRKKAKRFDDHRPLEIRKTGETIAILDKNSWGSSHSYDIYWGSERDKAHYVGYVNELEDAIKWCLDYYNTHYKVS